MKMSCIRLSAAVQIDAEDVSLLNMTYISQTFELAGTSGTMGFKQWSYADPYKTLK